MKRIVAISALASLITVAPAVLWNSTGGPRFPSQGLALDSRYLPLDPALQVLALVAWILWAYVALAVLLRFLGILVERTLGTDSILVVSDRVTPALLRRCIDIAVGGVVVAASLSFVRLASADPMPRAAAASVVTLGEEAAVTPSSEERKRPSYTVRPGDSLWRIAERELGSGYRWREVYKINKGRRFSDGQVLGDPRMIHPGWKLELPKSTEADPKQNTSTTRKHRESFEAPSPQAEGAPPTITAPSDAPKDTRPPINERTPDEVEDPQAEPLPLAPIAQLPSGAVIATSFACGLLSAELLARMRRRRARRPLSANAEIAIPEKLVRDLRTAGAEPTAGALDVAVGAIIGAWLAETGMSPRLLAAVEERQGITFLIADTGSSLPPSSGGSISPKLRFERAGGVVRAEVSAPFPVRLRRTSTGLQRGLLAPIGHADGVALHVAPLGTGTISIVGSCAGSVARQVILSQAVDADLDDLEVVIVGTSELGKDVPVPHVRHNADWEVAAETLQSIQAEFIRRAGLFQREGVEDIWEHMARHADEQLPALVLIVADPPAAMRGVIEAIAKEAPRFGSSLIALGWRPSETSVHIEATEDVLHLDCPLELPTSLSPFMLNEDLAQDALKVIDELAEETETIALDGADRDVIDDQLEHTLRVPPGSEVRLQLPSRSESRTPTPPPDVAAVYCLGAFSVSHDGHVRVKGWLRKSRELLAYLVAHPAGVPKERICDDLWPEEDPQRLRYLIDRAISRARLQVRAPDDFRMYLVKTEEAWRLEGGSWWVDVFEFERLLDASDHTDDPAIRVGLLRQALPLYRGNFCDDLAYAWAEPVRERLRSRFIRASAQLAEVLCSADENEEALEILDRAIQVDVLCEDLWRRAMVVEASLGRRAAAADRYERLRGLLARELDVEPDPESQRLARSIARLRPSIIEAERGTQPEMTAPISI